jgi:DNA-binding CsgD family transcriptional regulator
VSVDVRTRKLGRAFRRLGIEIADALAEINVPAFVLSNTGVIRWLNAAAIDAFGDQTGRHYGAVVAPQWRRAVDEQFTRKRIGTAVATSYATVLRGRSGKNLAAEIDSVRLEDHGRLVGVFGVVDLGGSSAGSSSRTVQLTPRQTEVLALLAAGASTDQIAARLHVSRETVRNHIRAVLRALDVHSRLEAVAQGRFLGIV